MKGVGGTAEPRGAAGTCLEPAPPEEAPEVLEPPSAPPAHPPAAQLPTGPGGQAIARRLAAGADLPLEDADLPLEDHAVRGRPLSPVERQQVLCEWAAAPPAPAGGGWVHREVEARAGEAGEGIAIAAPDECLSYGELERRAGSQARRLSAAGCGLEARIAVLLPSSPEWAVAILACLKAGAAYLPLDPAYPPERLAFLLADAGAAALLSRPALAAGLPPGASATPLVEPESAPGAGRGGPGVEIEGAHLAYVVYTSGSTGRPKGVAVTHAGLANLVRWHLAAYAVGRETRASLLAGVGFDAAAWEVWPALAAGARLAIPEAADRTLPRRLASWLVAAGVTASFAPTPLAEALLDEPWPPEAALAVLLTGGDRLSRRPRGEYRFRLVNHYGPTEATVVATAAEVAGGDCGPPPIGRPIGGVAAFLLDRGGRPLPPGAPGELYLGGPGLARGYLGRPAATAAAFVPHPFSGEGGARLYRSGDLAAFGADGRLRFLGRIDQQVKLRGIRIEPGEVESALAAHPELLAAAVVAVATGGGPALAAFVVPRGEGPPPAATLREFLRRTLPEPMVPASYQALTALPLTAHGKVDRAALAARWQPPAAGPDGGPPRTETEAVVAALWAEVLGLPAVGIEDDLLALGGFSLRAAQVAERVRLRFGVELDLAAVFAAPTVAGLARRIEARRIEVESAAEAPLPAPPLLPVSRSGALPLSFSQESLWLFAQLHPGSAAYNLPWALELVGELDVRALRRALSDLVLRHEALRTVFPSERGRARQVVTPGWGWRPPLVDLGRLADREAPTALRRLAAIEARRPFDLARGPVLRAVLVRSARGRHALLAMVHHIACDGWSVAILARELGALYRRRSTGAGPALPALPVQYADYAAWQRGWLTDEGARAHLEFWRRALGEGQGDLELPTDRPRPARPSFRGGVVRRSLPPALFAELTAGSRRLDATLFMGLLAAFAALLGRLSGQPRVRIGSPVAGRARVETEGLIGFFVNTLTLGLDLAGDPTGGELVARARATTLAAFRHQDLPFEELVARLAVDRRADRQPLFQTMLVLQNAPPAVLRLPGIEVRPLASGTAESAKFDLTLSAVEADGGLSLRLLYAADLFDRTTAERWLGCLLALLPALLLRPDARLASAPFLTAAERHQATCGGPAGDPEAGGRGRVLDRALRPVPLGAAGDLWLDETAGSPAPNGDARSAAKLLRPHPWRDRGARLLRAGRRGRRRPDGRLEVEGEVGPPGPAASGGERAAAPQAAAGARPPAVARPAEIERRREQLSDKKRALLARWARGGSAPAADAIPRRAAAEPARLSFAQERLWFLAQLEPGKPTYNVPLSLALPAGAVPSALARALDEIVRRHDVLRTRYEAPRGEPLPRVEPAGRSALPAVDLAGLGAAATPEARRLAAREARRPFDLERAPVVRWRLLRLPGGGARLLVTFHHIAFDAWSNAVFRRELAGLYRAFAAGRPSPLAELPIQHGDYAAWQRERLDDERLGRLLAHWRVRLADLPPELPLPADRPRPAAASGRGGLVVFRLPEGTAAAARELGRRLDLTPFMGLLAAFASLLGRYSGLSTIAVGTPIASRERRETEGLIGFFLNTLVLAVDLAGDPPFAEVCRRVRAVVLAAFEHQDMPFERLVQELNPERGPGRPALFQVMFALDAGPPDRGGEGGPAAGEGRPQEEALGVPEGGTGTAKFDLALGLAERGAGLVGLLEYSADLFDRATALRLARHFEVLLAGAAAGEGQRLSELPLLGMGEKSQLVVEWSDTRWCAGTDLCLHEHAAARAAEGPAAVALDSGGEQWSRGELARLARGLAGRLARRGVGAETRVGVAMERAPETVASLLAVLEAGGCYVPLDPRYPAERLAWMAGDAGVELVLTQPELAPGLPASDVPLWPVPALARIASGEADFPGAADGDLQGAADGAARRARPENLAYVMYTSGSTGRPKGVMVPHRGAVNRLLWAQRAYPVTAADRVLQKVSFTFDVSVWEIFGPLAAGARLVQARPGGEADPPYLWRAIRERAITLVHFVPAVLELFLGEEAAAGARGLRQVFAGGEELRPELVRRALSRLGVPLRNQYGPTEVSITATSALCRPDGEAGRPVSIGRPLPNVGARVVDGRLAPLPAGAVGELVVGGVGVTRGYHGRPALTAERFVPDPAAESPGARLYRTGDRVRARPDGELEFVGRGDGQVKLRGLRLELGEIRAALAALPGVAGAAVVVREDAPGDRRLVGYAVPAAGAALDAGELRERLARSLPPYMVPSALVVLPALPLTRAGKLDPQALPAPAAEERRPLAGAAPAGAAPAGPVAEVLAGIWCEVLGVAAVGPQDGFFDLGGHSLAAVRMVARVRQAFGFELPLAAVFERPTLAALAAALESGLRETAVPAAPPLARARRDRPLPLSFAQERLWFLDRLQPGLGVYNIPYALRLPPGVDLRALAASLGHVVRRHEVLRTGLVEGPEGPEQRIAPAAGLALPRVDLAALPPPARAAAAASLAGREARRPFDLAAPPLLRALLVEGAPGGPLLCVTVHHVAFDAGSQEVLFGETATLYGAFARGAPSPLPELDFQYADYALWQREWLAGEVLAAELAHWRRRLAGAPALLELPADRPRPAGAGSQAGEVRRFAVPADLADRLAALGRRHQATPFMVLLAGFGVLLLRHTGQRDLPVGSPVLNRGHRELEGLIGFFTNTLVLRLELAGDPSLAEALARVRRTALDAYGHRELPFEKLVSELQPERNLGHHPLFQVSFTLEVPRARGRDAPLAPALAASETATGLVKFDLSLGLVSGAGGLAGSLAYRSELFDGTTAARLADHYRRLLAAMVERPGARLSELPLLAPAERAQLLGEWSDRSAPAGEGEATLDGLFAARAGAQPEAVALVAGEDQASYAALARDVRALARRLCALGVGPEARAGVAMERAPEMATALLAVLSAGGAYVPLDPEYPAERLAWMVADAGLAIVLTQGRLAVELPAGCPRLAVETGAADRAAVGEGEGGDGPPGAGPDRLAYVIYTSGSTGRPKGVMVPHRGVVNRLLWAQRTYPVTAADRVLAKASFAFDFSVWELLGTLAAGARLVLARPGGQRDSAYLVRSIQEQAVTLLHFVPSMLQAFLEEDGLAACRSLRFVFAGGEALRPEAVERFAERVPAGLRNQYGPTEISIDMTEWVLPRGAAAPALVPIGRPIASAQARVLDRHGGPVAAGVAGELAVGGVGVARGYLRRPALTAGRFVPDPFAGRRGARLYLTGDRVRWRADGELEFLGRLDRKVKLRGLRIEPDEIATVLAEHPAVARAVVTVAASASGGRVVAYVVPAAGRSPAPAELAAFLQGRLPAWMVPGAFVELAALPLGPTGKLDLAALPPPDALAAEGETRSSTPIEGVLAAIWSQVLGVAEVGPGDDFFALGGHSLAATRVISRLRRELGVELPLAALFERPTLAALAGAVEEAMAAGAPVRPPLVAIDRGRPLPLSFAQERLWFIDRFEPGTALYNVPAAYRLGASPRPRDLARALAAVVGRHEALRTVFRLLDGAPVQEVQAPRAPQLATVDLAGLEPAARRELARRLAAREARRQFDLARGPLLRARLLRLAPDERAFLLTLHHIACDGWSMRILEEEVGRAAATLAAGEPLALPHLPIQYGDFAVWQRGWLRGEALAQGLAFWRARLAGLPALLDLPTDRPRPARQGFAGASRPLRIPPATCRAVRELSRRAGATPFMTLLAAFQAVLARHSGRSPVVVGTPEAGRDAAETEGLIGCFVNTLVLATDLTGDPSFLAALARVRKAALAAYAHRELPFEKLVEELQPERSPACSPLFQVMFTFEAAGPRRGAGSSGVGRLGATTGTAKFDLTLALSEGADAIAGWLLYRVDLFDGSTVERLGRQLVRLLAAAGAGPERRLSELDRLAAEERAQLLLAFNDTERALPPVATVLELWADQVERAPERAAMVAGEAAWSYRGLDRRAGLLARSLARAGVGLEDRVALHCERSVELAAAELASWKVGAAFVPVDPAHPAGRLAFTLADAGAKALVRSRGAPGHDPGPGVPTFAIEEAAPPEETGPPPFPAPGREHLAYVLYTSGSTGMPKGAEVVHGGLVNLVAWHARAYRLGAGTRASMVAGPAFDASIWELWPYLATGGTVAVAPPEAAPDPGRLLAWLAAERVGIAFLPTPLTEAVLGERPPGGLALAVLLTGGDRLRRAPPAASPFRVVNHYGPTEATVLVTAGQVRGGGGQPPDLGRPVDNTRLQVLDRELRPLPLGVPGELVAAGAGLARGYLRRPALTASRFVPDALAGRPGGRSYRTGDLGRWLPDGRLAFLGRLDHQVKVRGHRVELGEVEAALAAHPAVAQAVVVGREEAAGERRLVAYVVVAAGSAVAPEELRRHLQARLPEPMVPAVFVELPTLPLGATGKVDRAALPAPGPALAAGGGVGPRDELELALVRIWEEVLAVPSIGLGDDFFALGGHSLAAVRLAATVEARLGVPLPLARVFEAPTVERQAALLRSGAAAPPRRALVPLAGSGDLPPLFLVHPVGGNVFCYLPLARRLAAERPVIGIQTPDPAPGEPFAERLEEMAASHVAAVREARPSGPYLLGGWSLGGVIALEMARQLRAAGEEVPLVALLDSFAPRGPAEPPPAEALAERFLRDLAGLAGAARAAGGEEGGEGPRRDPASLVEEGRRLLALPEGAGEGRVEALFVLFAANLAALARYRAEPYLGRTLLVVAAEEPPGDPTRGWSSLVPRLEVRPLPCAHYGVLREPAVEVLAELLRATLAASGT